MKIHIVQKGDTLWKISKKYGVNFEELKAVNTQLSNPDMIMPGMKIKVPQGKKTVKKEAPKKEAPKKEAPKMEAPKKEAPKKEMPKQKPIPKIKEDEKIPQSKPNQPMPNQPMPNQPMPMMEKPMMPIQMNMPIQMPMDQHNKNYYTSFHLPQMPPPEQEMPPLESSEVEEYHHKPMKKPMQKPIKQPMNQPMQQPMQKPMQQPMQKPMQQPMNQPMQQPMNQEHYAQEFPYCPPVPLLPQAFYHWDHCWYPPYAMPMGMQHHPHQIPYHQEPQHQMPQHYGMGGIGNNNAALPYMKNDSQDGGCGCGGGAKQPMYEENMMSYEGNQPNQMHNPHMNGWNPPSMMNGNPGSHGYYPQPPQNPLGQWGPTEPWQDDDEDDS